MKVALNAQRVILFFGASLAAGLAGCSGSLGYATPVAPPLTLRVGLALADAAPAPAPAPGAVQVLPQPMHPPAPAGSAGPGAVTLPPAARLRYELSVKASGLPLRLQTETLWQPEGDRYTLHNSLKHFLGSRNQTSSGTITAQGITPERFTDLFRRERSAQFDRAAGLVRFSEQGRAPVPLEQGAQDLLSAPFQVGALVAAQPGHFGVGSPLSLQVIKPHGAEQWTMRVKARETQTIGGQAQPVVHLVSETQVPGKTQVELWVAPELHGLPVRIRIQQASGDTADQVLVAHSPP